jgi:hypothetical protein
MGRFFFCEKGAFNLLVQTKEEKATKAGRRRAESRRVLFFYTTMVLPSPSFFSPFFFPPRTSKLHPIATALKISDFRSVPSP